jgi:hypothetical protein
MSDTAYAIPSAESQSFGLGKKTPLLFLVIPTLLFFVFLKAGLHIGIEAAIVGFFITIPIVIITALVHGLVTAGRMKANWEKHSFAWYRAAFPKHAHDEGHVSCRHCGSHKVLVTNLMNKTFMRVHACARCGETLYFSPEKI